MLGVTLAQRMNTEREARISAQHSAVTALQRFRENYNAMPVGIFSMKHIGTLIEHNPTFAEMFPGNGRRSSKIGLNWVELTNLEALKAVKELTSSDRMMDTELAIERPDGKRRWFHVRAVRKVDRYEGWIEEITATYVVVRIWDQRRLVMPLQWFIENPFQNWTRSTSEILGTVLLWVDYRMPVDLIRQEAERLCREAVEWDGRVCVTHVVDAGPQAKQLRVLVSAADAGMAWDLRCKLREQLIDFIQRDYPQYLPRIRAEVSEHEVPASPSIKLEP